MADPLRVLLKPLASVRLTVALLAMSIFLIFAGTWAQIDMGIWQTLKTYFRTTFVFIPFQIFFPREWSVPGGIPFPGGLTLGALLFVNLLMAHALRFKFNRKRIGILLIHFSLIMLIAGEFITGMFAEEGRMSIDEGETTTYAEDTREVELAIVDTSDPEIDRVVVIPQALLEREKRIQDPALPFDVQVDAFFPNTDLVDASSAPPGPRADRGAAVQHDLAAIERPVVSGVEQNVIDLPVALVTLSSGGEPLGTWLAALYFTLLPEQQIQTVAVGDRTYVLALRYKRVYKPYSIHLVDFRHDRYLGTDTPRNYSSQVRLVDASHNEDREVLIYMNNPLRYRGETFYQASFKQGDSGTILQVVHNPGWLVPYVACALGAIGLIVQFVASLSRFLGKRRAVA